MTASVPVDAGAVDADAVPVDSVPCFLLVDTDAVLVGAVGTLCGTGEPGALNGPGATATLHQPFSVTVDDEGRLVYISDRSPHVRRAAMSDAGGTYSPSVTTAYSDNTSLSTAGGVAYAYGWSSLLVTNLERSTLHRLDLDFVLAVCIVLS